MTPHALLKEVTARFRAVGIDGAGVEARWLTEHILKLDYAGIISAGSEVSEAVRASLMSAVEQRLSGTPLAYLTGKQGFWKQELHTGPGALIPRGDTETLIELVLRERGGDGYRILDMGTGSGAILIALLSEYPGSTGIGTDVSADALDIARMNVEACDVAERADLILSDWFENIEGTFDILVGNPPYIPDAVIETLDTDVKDHEPYVALSGGSDGFAAYRVILSEAGQYLKPGGLLALEMGYDQGAELAGLFNTYGFAGAKVEKDSGQQDRVVWAQKAH